MRALDYQSDKKAYLNNIWSIINWEIINDRLSINKSLDIQI